MDKLISTETSNAISTGLTSSYDTNYYSVTASDTTSGITTISNSSIYFRTEPITVKRYEVNWEKIKLKNMHLLYSFIEDHDGSSEVRVYQDTSPKKVAIIEKMAKKKWLIEMVLEKE